MVLKKRIIVILLVMAMLITYMPSYSFAAGNIASGTCGTCNWVIDANGVLTFSGGELDDWGDPSSNYLYDEQVVNKWPDWHNYRNEITAVRATNPVILKTGFNMFDGCVNVTSIDTKNFDTSKVRVLDNMFRGCESLKSLDLKNFNTSATVCMRRVFADCSALQSLDFRSFDTTRVTTMQYMFSQCSSLKSLNVSSFNTQEVRNMEGMFFLCESLTSLDLGSFNTYYVENMSRFMDGCESLSVLKVGKNFNAHVVTGALFYFPKTMYDSEGSEYPEGERVPPIDYMTYYANPHDAGDEPSARKYKYYSTEAKYLKQTGFDSVPSMRSALRNWMNTDLGGPIPGIIKTNISDGKAYLNSKYYVPQGLCKFGSYYLITAYENPKELKQSVIYVLDRNWDLKTTVTIGDYAFHNGGIAYDPKSDVLWFCGNTEPDYPGIPFVYGLAAGKLREAISSGDKMFHIDSFTTDEVYINNKPSCLDYHNGRLWVGTCGSSKGSIVGYKINGTNLDTNNTVHITNVEKNLNGFTFENDSTLYASYSSGRSRAKYSKINRYNVSGRYSKGSTLKAESARVLDVPRMNEEIMISDGYLYILYESGAEAYNNAFIKTDRITPLPTSLWSTGAFKSSAKLMVMENSGVSSTNIGDQQTISFQYSSSEGINETTYDLTFTPEESGLYTISVSDLNGSDNVFVTTEVTDTENYLGNSDTTQYRYTDKDESDLPYDLYDGSSCKVFLTGGNTYNICMTADILETYDPDAYEAEEPIVEFSGSYNLTVSGETDLSALVPEVAEGEEMSMAVSEGDAGCFCFTPEKSGTYRIYLSSNGTLGDILILKDMKDAVSFNGELCDLEAGEKYYFITSLSEGSVVGADAEIRFTASGLESEELGTDEPVTVTGDTSINYTATKDGMQIIKVEGGSVEQITVFDQNGDTIAAGDGDVVFETQKNEKYRIMCTGCEGEISVSVSAYNEDDPEDPTPEDPTPVDPQPIDPTPTPTPAPAVTPASQAPAEIQDLPAVKMSKLAAAKKLVNVKWKKVSKKNQKKIQGIEIQVATDPGFTDIVKTATAGKKKTSKKIKGLTSKQTYYVRIRAYKDAADGRHVSAWKAKKVKAK